VRGRVVFVFVGTFNRTQHPALLLDAIDRLEQCSQNDPSRFAFLIGGDGIDADLVRERARRFENVHYVGWLKPREMDVLLSHSDVGLLLMNYPSEAFNNKSFSYLASGLPIISGASGDLFELIEQEKIGINVPAGNPDSLARAIARLADDQASRKMFLRNVQNLYDRRFNREVNYESYADHVEAVAFARRASPSMRAVA
jgi:glycosyltransferase involved in cell wall biosynthesis